MVNSGTVIATENGKALIKVVRKSACSGCEGREACEGSLIGDCMKTAEVTVLANNPIGAEKGDKVEFASSTGMTLGIAVLVFIVPLVMGFVSYYIAAGMMENTLYPYLVSLAFFAAAFVILFFGIDKMLKGKIKVTVTKILEDEKDNR